MRPGGILRSGHILRTLRFRFTVTNPMIRMRTAVRGRKRPDLTPLADLAGQATQAREDMFKQLTETRKELEAKLKSLSVLDETDKDLKVSRRVRCR